MTRAGNADFTGNVGDFIGFAEDMMNFGYDDGQIVIPPLRVAQMEIRATTLTILASSNTVTLPSDFLELRRLYLTGNPNLKLTYVTPTQMDATLPNSNADPQAFYTLMGGAVVLGAPVNSTQTLVGGYYRKVPALSSSNTVNWLLTAFPSLYLAGACLHGAIFVGAEEDSAKWARMFTGYMRSFQKQDLKGRYSGDALQMKTDVGNP